MVQKQNSRQIFQLLKRLNQLNQRTEASPEEQEIMLHYSGWGGLSSAFDESKTEWENEYLQLILLKSRHRTVNISQ